MAKIEGLFIWIVLEETADNNIEPRFRPCNLRGGQLVLAA